MSLYLPQNPLESEIENINQEDIFRRTVHEIT